MVKRIEINGVMLETPKNREQMLEDLLVQLMSSRHLCFIPDAGPLLGWEARVNMYIKVRQE